VENLVPVGQIEHIISFVGEVISKSTDDIISLVVSLLSLKIFHNIVKLVLNSFPKVNSKDFIMHFQIESVVHAIVPVVDVLEESPL
jgi:hypothetical protein